ncbi:MAG: N-acetylmuramoyl-L-alanine amidase [Pseudolabrys sp.]
MRCRKTPRTRKPRASPRPRTKPTSSPASILLPEPDDIANILVDLAQRETKTYSSQFARTLVGELKATARLHKNPLKAAGFKVLTAPDVPSVLVRLGYMSTKDDSSC